jgi:ribosome-associated translation inhibitor RaiA
MKVQFASKGLVTANGVRAHAVRRLHFALDRFTGRVTQVRVRLVDVSGPRGGVDIQCLIQVWVSGIGALVVKVMAADPDTAIDRAAERIHRLVARHLDRQFKRRGRSARSDGE